MLVSTWSKNSRAEVPTTKRPDTDDEEPRERDQGIHPSILKSETDRDLQRFQVYMRELAMIQKEHPKRYRMQIMKDLFDRIWVAGKK